MYFAALSYLSLNTAITHNGTDKKKTAEAVEVTKAIRKRKNRRSYLLIRRTFGEYLSANLPRRTFLALCHNAGRRRFVRTIYRSLGRLLFEHIGPLLFRAFCIGFESWL